MNLDRIRFSFEKNRTYLDLRMNKTSDRYLNIQTNAYFNEFLDGYNTRCIEKDKK